MAPSPPQINSHQQQPLTASYTPQPTSPLTLITSTIRQTSPNNNTAKMQFTTTAIIAAFAAIAAAAPGGGYPGGYPGGCQTGNCGGGYGGYQGGYSGQLCCYKSQPGACWAPGTPGYPSIGHPDVDVYDNCGNNKQGGLLAAGNLLSCDVLNGNQIAPINLQLLNFGETTGGNFNGGNDN
ncbi:hypothetical protein CB0940_10353 [Cercospora beticola]|uniref:Uncharacterized protein n=1 Tax=Cercospora beticola TaxID=122368 RepID=A0A2G5HTD2_CERBT|nr:hypothetical protein CB0940_10353 [Cercospora beticola]PIA95790.1 hypothetical protein CB0940_10353 [Cercospora beticola]WPB07067.1 hypothetical protein RHO25_011727 [Cercospora beticola]CAK1367013.1 unnamed protein product [Cercospora beticola]